MQTWSKMNKKTFQIFSKSDYISFGYSQVNMGEKYPKQAINESTCK